MSLIPAPWRDEMRALVSLALPMILGNLVQAAIGATDLAFLGHLGSAKLAAAALGFNLYIALLIFGVGIVTAVAPMIAIERGRRPHSVRDVRRTVRQGMWMAIVVSLPMLAILWFAEPILLAIGEEPVLARDAGIFVRAVEWSIVPYLLHMALRQYVSALERPIGTIVVMAVTLAANALFGWILIFGHFGFPALGLAGAGLGSTLANTVLFIGMAILVMRHPHFRRYRLFGRFWVADWPRFAALWRLGLPIGVTLGLEVTVFNAAVLVMGLIDRDSLAAHAIAIQLASIAFMVPMGLAQAVTVRVGLGQGAGDAAAVTRAGWVAILASIGFACVMALIFAFAAGPLIGLFLDRGDPANANVLHLATGFLWIAALFQIVDGLQAVGAGAMRGLQDTRWPMVYAATGYWVFGLGIGTTLAFRFGLNGFGIWIGLASGLAAVSLLMMHRWTNREALGLVVGVRSAPRA